MLKFLHFHFGTFMHFHTSIYSCVYVILFMAIEVLSLEVFVVINILMDSIAFFYGEGVTTIVKLHLLLY